MIHSTTYITRNEHGQEEVQIERSLTLFEIIRSICKNRTFKVERRTTDEYVCISRSSRPGSSEVWVNKKTGNRVSDKEDWAILGVQVHAILSKEK